MFKVILFMQSVERNFSMEKLKEFGIILLFSFVGEILNRVIPLPVPASIYGIVLLFAALMTGLVKLKSVEKAGSFLIEIMPVMFIPAAVGIMNSAPLIKNSFLAYVIITAVSTVAVMAVSGLVTQLILRRQKAKNGKKE